MLVEKGFDIDATLENGRSALHLLCDRYYNLDGAKALLELGADPNLPDQHGATPFSLAAETRDYDFYDEEDGNHIFNYSTDWQEPGIEKYRYTGQEEGDFQKGFDLVKLFVESGKAELNMQKVIDAGCKTPLGIACWNNNWQIIDYLLEVTTLDTRPGMVNQEAEKDPFLSWMVRCDPRKFNVKVLRKALEKGANPNQWCGYQRNPLYYITNEITSLEGLALLIDFGGDPFLEDGNGLSAAKNLLNYEVSIKREILSFVKTEEGRQIVEIIWS